MAGRQDETRWLSYAELARAKAISKRAAVRLANRQGWQHRPDNRGPARVAVPASALARPPNRATRSLATAPERAGVRTDGAETRTATLAAELAELRAQITDLRLGEASARTRAEAAEAEVARLREVLDNGPLRRLRQWFRRSGRS